MVLPFRHKRLGYLALNVTDIEQATRFATDLFGHDLVTEDAAGVRYFRCAAHRHDLTVQQPDRAGLMRTSWELENPAALDKERTSRRCAPGSIDTPMMANLALPKSAPSGVASAVVAGLQEGQMQIWPGECADDLRRRLHDDPVGMAAEAAAYIDVPTAPPLQT